MRDGTTLTADPDPVIGEGSPKLGITTISWKAPVTAVEIRIGGPGGQLWGQGGGTGSGTTGNATGRWASNGMTFYLQDATTANPKDASATLAKLTLRVK